MAKGLKKTWPDIDVEPGEVTLITIVSLMPGVNLICTAIALIAILVAYTNKNDKMVNFINRSKLF